MTEIQRTALHNLLTTLSEPTKFNEAMRSLYAFSRANVPPFLYRYRRCGCNHSFDDVENELLTLSSASCFDDSDDTVVHDAGELDRFADTIATQNETSLQILQKIIPIASSEGSKGGWLQLINLAKEFLSLPEEIRKENLNHLKRQVRNSVNLDECNASLRARQKIACFCENGKSDYMWKNYAGNGTGYLIEYDSSKLYTIDTQHNRVPHILPVVYCKKPIDTYLLLILSGLSDDNKMMLDEEIFEGCLAIELISTIFYKRYDPYVKEEEWRLMLTPLDSERDDKFIFRKLTPTRLIAGPHMSPSDKNRLYNCANNNSILIVDYGESFDEMVKRIQKHGDYSYALDRNGFH